MISSPELPVEIIADSIAYDAATETYTAQGDVVIMQGKAVIKADTVVVNMKSSLATATGHMEAVDEEGNILKGESFELQIDTKVGVITKARLFFEQENVHVTGEEIKKTGEASYSVRDGFFTTCDCEEGESPAWGFSTAELNVTLGEYMTAWNTLFYIKSVPVLYSPYILFPVKRDRETGFLFPRIGYSELRGFKLDNSFFWAISDSTDATFFLDIETKRGLGKGIEYRYVLSTQSEGSFNFYQFKEKDMDRVREFRSGSNNLSRPETADDDRWFFQYKHRGIFPYGVLFKASVNEVSDDEYFIDFGKDTNERSLESLESNVSFTKTWDTVNLVTQFRYFDNLLVANDSITLQRLPELTFTGRDQQIVNTPFHVSFESSFVNFERKEGLTGQRIDAHPTLSLPLNPGGWFEFKPSAGVRETMYWIKDPLLDRYHERTIYDLSADLTTTFVRIVAWNNEGDGLQKLKHSIRPKVTYTYIPDQAQDDLPQFDAADRIAKRNDVAYSLNSILTGKFGKGEQSSYLDYVYLDLSQSYDINEAKRKLISLDDKRRPLSDVSGELKLMPAQWSLLAAKGKYDPYDKVMNEYDASLGLWDKRGDRLDVSYRYIRTAPPLEYMDISLKVKPMQSIDLSYRNRYSYSDEKSIESVYGLEYHHQCWGVQLTYNQRLEEKIVFVSFNLLGIGEVGGVSGTVK